jgi:2-oxoglutarate ferredoxin oxidoreductase subunit delta
MPRVIIEVDKCKGCGICITVCPKKILKFSGKFNVSGYNYVECTDESMCILCKSCVLMCPDVVFTLIKEE